EVATGKVRHLTPHKGDVQYQSPVWLKDGEHVLCISTHNGWDLPTVACIELSSGEITIGRIPRHETESIVASADGRRFAVSENIDGCSRIRLHSGFGGYQPEVAGLPPGVANGITFSRDGRMIAFGYDGPRYNSDVWFGQIDIEDDCWRE